MSLFSKKYTPEKFAVKAFDIITNCSAENNKIFNEKVCKDYHETIFVTFFMVYGIQTVNYFIDNKYNCYNKKVSDELFSTLTERIIKNFSEDTAEMILDCASQMEDVILDALQLPFVDELNNPYITLAQYIPTVIDIRNEINIDNAYLLLFECLGEMFVKIQDFVNKTEIED